MRPRVPSPPPDPVLNGWQLGFSHPGPPGIMHWRGLPADAEYWQGRVHESAAYRYYMDDHLPEAVEAAEKALAFGARPECWSAHMRYIAAAELEARQRASRPADQPLVFELPADDRSYDGLVDVAETCSTRVQAMLGFRPRSAMVTLLGEERLLSCPGSRWGYMALKTPYAKICLLRGASHGLYEPSVGLVHEYVRLAVYELSEWQAPHWLCEGLGWWFVRQFLPTDRPSDPDTPPSEERQPLREIDRAFDPEHGLSTCEELDPAWRQAESAVTQLIEAHGEPAVADFLASVAKRGEGRAFRAAFGRSRHQFEREWAAQVRAGA